VVADLALGVEAQVRHAAHDLRLPALAPQADAKIELPDQHGAAGIGDLVDDDETRLADLLEHVAEDALDGRHAAHFVERVLEIGVGAVELGKRATLSGVKLL
jgi:hypothetical protein